MGPLLAEPPEWRPSVNTRNEQSSESDVSDVKVFAWPSSVSFYPFESLAVPRS